MPAASQPTRVAAGLGKHSTRECEADACEACGLVRIGPDRSVGYGGSDEAIRTEPRRQRGEDELPSSDRGDSGVNELPSVALTTKFVKLSQQYGSEQLAVRIIAAGRSTGVPGLPQSND